ncbi:2-amino-4-hydroxy-6-hydroxymethyldihydropteridine diphosphokinase [Balneatrix alpica]|uniref:2-amino-4-hydroxy-6-hydroxymethyldihydropteridine diphosphokinase n=1 Tax=Balneatrix alpica TaxID=75684 RepID=A0ABV5ZD73_9GAMM|nr:2-amino-4-hydroxy-6-hydroxymethyldihydropteridine diphosphokinase [Balneatrix alpica]
MVKVWLGLGSNQQADYHIAAGLQALQQVFGHLRVSPIYRCAAVGFSGPAFYNLVVELHTDWSLDSLAQWLRQLEYRYGRPAQAQKYSGRTLDIDILSYADYCGSYPLAGRQRVQLPREDLLQPFVLAPLAALAPEACAPGQAQSCQQLWQLHFPAGLAGLNYEEVRLDWQAPLAIPQAS